jgi:hypothetical protein
MGHHGGKPAGNCLSYGMAKKSHYLLWVEALVEAESDETFSGN